MTTPALLALEDGSQFHGISIGADGHNVGEIAFNTAITGYQEILTDPSYCNQFIALTHPHIGNTGINSDDQEAETIHAAGLIMREYSPAYSNWRAQPQNLSDYLKAHGIIAIAEIDTRRLTRKLREQGSLKACIITGGNIKPEDAIAHAQNFHGLLNQDLTQQVSTQSRYQWQETAPVFGWNNTQHKTLLHIIAYDFGIKKTILRYLASLGCAITVVPCQTPAEEVLAEKPDGVFLSNGPGDPQPCQYAIDAVRQLRKTPIPIFGICLGHQLIAHALGAQTFKMKFGHHGANHPVKDHRSGKVIITSQNHNFAVNPESVPEDVSITHTSLFDGSIQGLSDNTHTTFGFQGHPEASPGPHDATYLFQNFIESMKTSKH